MKALERDACSNSKLEPNMGKQIIDVEPSVTISATKVLHNEPKDLEEGKCLFHA